jgi:hypothetical protein
MTTYYQAGTNWISAKSHGQFQLKCRSYGIFLCLHHKKLKMFYLEMLDQYWVVTVKIFCGKTKTEDRYKLMTKNFLIGQINCKKFEQLYSPHNEHQYSGRRPVKLCSDQKILQFLFIYIKINSRIWFRPVNSNLPFADCYIWNRMLDDGI